MTLKMIEGCTLFFSNFISYLPTYLLIFLSLFIFRWREVVESSDGGGVFKLQTLVEKMPDVAEVWTMFV